MEYRPYEGGVVFFLRVGYSARGEYQPRRSPVADPQRCTVHQSVTSISVRTLMSERCWPSGVLTCAVLHEMNTK